MRAWLPRLAQPEMPIGSACAVWVGIGGAGIFIIGVLFFGDPQSMARRVGVAMIVDGVAVLKLSH